MCVCSIIFAKRNHRHLQCHLQTLDVCAGIGQKVRQGPLFDELCVAHDVPVSVRVWEKEMAVVGREGEVEVLVFGVAEGGVE